MYYGQSSRNSNATKTQQTILLLVLLALTVVCVGLAIVYSSASKANTNVRQVLVSQIQIEVSAAKTRASQPLPASGSRTEFMVAAVRQHVYAARTINEMAAKVYGRGNELINGTYINRCIELLDDCDRGIQQGSVVTSMYDQLGNAIEELFREVSSLE